MAKSELSAHFFDQKSKLKKKRSPEDLWAPLGMLHAKFGSIWMKNPGLVVFLPIFQLKKDVISVI